MKKTPLRLLMVKNTIFDPFVMTAPKDGRVSCNDFLTEETPVISNTSETKRKEVGCAWKRVFPPRTDKEDARSAKSGDQGHGEIIVISDNSAIMNPEELEDEQFNEGYDSDGNHPYLGDFEAEAVLMEQYNEDMLGSATEVTANLLCSHIR